MKIYNCLDVLEACHIFKLGECILQIGRIDQVLVAINLGFDLIDHLLTYLKLLDYSSFQTLVDFDLPLLDIPFLVFALKHVDLLTELETALVELEFNLRPLLLDSVAALAQD